MLGSVKQIYRDGDGHIKAQLLALDKDAGATPDGSPVWLSSGEQGTITVAPAGHPYYIGDFGAVEKGSKLPVGRKWTTTSATALAWFKKAAVDAAPSRLLVSNKTWKTQLGPLVAQAEDAKDPATAIDAYNKIVAAKSELSIPKETARRLLPLADLAQLGKAVGESPEMKRVVSEQMKRDARDAARVAADAGKVVSDAADGLWDTIPTWAKVAGGATLAIVLIGAIRE